MPNQTDASLAGPAATANCSLTLPQHSVVILDCGAQYTKVIDRRVRELNICSSILPLNTPLEQLKSYDAIILSGGPNSVFEPDAPTCDPALFELGKPVLGICYGMQLMAHLCGGTVQPAETKEYGQTHIEVDPASPLFKGLGSSQPVLMSHGDHLAKLPDGFKIIGQSPDALAAVANEEKQLYGVQFHPEVDLTQHGKVMLENFLLNVAGLEPSFTLEHRLDDICADIQQKVGSHNVIVLVSGGVDSAVTAALLLKALPSRQVYAVHMDTGFMRQDESQSVCQALKEQGVTNLTHLNVADTFLNATTDIDGDIVGPLKDLVDPEQKRRIIGDTFFSLTQKTMKSLNLDMDTTFIAQGTLRPDLIESGSVEVSQTAHKIKTHHNDVPIIQEQRDKGLIIEPNRDLHKDEVRRIGAMLGLPDEIVHRQPFPGPGLAIRVLCATKPYPLEKAQETHGVIHKLCQPVGLQATVLPVRSVGVQGDFRSYRHLVALSGKYPKDWPVLEKLAQAIPNQAHEINRVALVLNPEQTITQTMPDWVEQVTPTTLNTDILDMLRRIDDDVASALKRSGHYNAISQLLTVLVPVDTQYRGRHSIAIRAVMTNDYMTARPTRLGSELPWEVMLEIDRHIRQTYPIDLVMVDLTSKPPATVEWE